MAEIQRADPPVRTRQPRAWVWGFARLAVRTFYRVERLGTTLPDGPLLLIANHPNTLLDPAILQTTAGRQIRFLAKSTLFQGHPLSPFIRNSGAIPVFRKIDPGVDTSRNAEMFVAVEAALPGDEAICLFPEGISHDRGRLETLRTGAARMVLASGAQGHPVTIAPVGLNFERVARFRSRVTTVFGQPFDGHDLIDRFTTDPQAAVHALTRRMSEQLRLLLVEADPRIELPVVARIDRLYASARGVSREPGERLRRRRLIADGMDRLRRRDPERFEAILEDVRAYDASLERFRLRDRDVDRRIAARDVRRFILREGGLAVPLAPLAAVGLALFAVPYWVTGQISLRAPDLQSRATWQVLGGLCAYGVWIALAALAAGVWLGPRAAAAVAVGMMALAFAGRAAVERETAVVRTISAFLALRQTPLRARAALKRQRAALAEVLERVQEWLGDSEQETGDNGEPLSAGAEETIPPPR